MMHAYFTSIFSFQSLKQKKYDELKNNGVITN